MLLTCQLVGGKNSLPASHSVADQFGQRGRDQVDRVFGQMRVGDVALHALDGELAAHACRAGRS